MFTFSNFTHVWGKSTDYKVFVNGEEVPVYTCRVSKHPYNLWWKGRQRPFDQSEEAAYVNIVAWHSVVEDMQRAASSVGLNGKVGG